MPIGKRFNSKVVKSGDSVLAQAPNRVGVWSQSQIAKAEVYDKYARFQGKDLTKQPKPYSAMELIAEQEIRYLEHDNVAVCDGNKGSQGHPRIYINLDQPKLSLCGYCGLRFAKKQYKDIIEKASV